MGPRLVEHLLYEPEDSGILWIKFNRPERMNALVGTAEENSTVAKVGEYMRAGDDDPEHPRDRAHRRRTRLLFRRQPRRPGRVPRYHRREPPRQPGPA